MPAKKPASKFDPNRRQVQRGPVPANQVKAARPPAPRASKIGGTNDYVATKGGGGRGVWKSKSGTNLGTARSEDSPVRPIKRTPKKPQ